MAEAVKKTETFEPRIVAFLCHWCTYTGADLAGTTRQQYPPNVRVVHLMCSGAVDVVYILKALMDGADAVLVGGCHPGDCHYQSGNFKARRRVAILRNVLDQFGIPKERVWLRWISASEGQMFAETIREITEATRKMGPAEFRLGWDV